MKERDNLKNIIILREIANSIRGKEKQKQLRRIADELEETYMKEEDLPPIIHKVNSILKDYFKR